MSLPLPRTDQSAFAQWWWTVDRWTLAALLALMGFGSVLVMAASPAVAERIHVDGLHFIERYFAVLPLAVAAVVAVSLQTPKTVRRIAFAVFIVSLALVAFTFVGGVEIKGARRWINLPFLAIQPSEFIKPSFAVISAWLFAEQRREPRFPGNAISIALLALVVGMLAKQPDLGMAAVVSVVWLGQFFLAGLRVFWVGVGLGCGAGGLVGAYFTWPHVASRIDHFLSPDKDEGYQVSRSMDAFTNGGLWGQGPGEGVVKNSLPDAHADFVFAVAGEELGLIACLVIVVLFAFIVMRGFGRALQDNNLFVILAAAGLFAQFGLQAAINMASTLHMMPTKGMTLPFISYGGSSMLALGLGMGMALALTRRRFAGVET